MQFLILRKVMEYEKPRQKRGLKPITFGKVKSYWRKNNRKISESQREIRLSVPNLILPSPILFKPSVRHKKLPSRESSVKKDGRGQV